ncbi:MAG: DUF975 family protein [Eubacteriales bacterium]
MEYGLLKEDAKSKLSGNWPKAAVVTFVLWLLTDAFTQEAFIKFGSSGSTTVNPASGLFNIISLIVTGSLALGAIYFYMKLESGEEPNISIVFDGFQDFKRGLIFHLVSSIFIILWTLLLVVPGIIAAIRYSMGYYLMIENPDMEPMEALRESSELMKGYKMDFFMFALSFLGWALLSAITLGIGFLLLVPYYQMSKLNFYRKITGDTSIGNDNFYKM